MSSYRTTLNTQVIEAYGACADVPIVDETFVWCPVTGRHHYPEDMAVHYLIPKECNRLRIGEFFNQGLFGHQLMHSLDNGIPVHKLVAEAFDTGAAMLMPTPSEIRGYASLDFVMLDDTILDFTVYGRTTFRDIDGLRLQFKNNFRPGRCPWYFHYVTNILKVKIRQPEHRLTKPRNLPRESPWTNPGKMLRPSTLEAIAQAITGDPRNADLFAQKNPDNAPTLDHQEAESMARNLVDSLWALERKPPNLYGLVTHKTTEDDEIGDMVTTRRRNGSRCAHDGVFSPLFGVAKPLIAPPLIKGKV